MKSRCLACGCSLGIPVFSIKDLPLVDSFSSDHRRAKNIDRYDIDICQCDKCLTLQIKNPPDTSDVYKNYIYESKSSPDLNSHFKDYAAFVKAEVKTKSPKILEIGANDGLLIEHLFKLGFSDITAIDPSPQASNIDPQQAKVINDFFNEDTFSRLKAHSYDLILANNCFSHIPNLKEVLRLCEELLTKNGAMVVEVQSTLHLLENAIFDYIYHEHFFYHTLTSFDILANLVGLEVHDVYFQETKGGSFRFLVRRKGSRAISHSVSFWKYRETVGLVHSVHAWDRLARYIGTVKDRLHQEFEKRNGRIVGYGACATGTVLLHHLELNKFIDLLVDDNPKRQGLFAPGSGLIVRPKEAIGPSDVCLILAWRHSKMIRRALPSCAQIIDPLPFVTRYSA